jgi:TatD DNase family protein
VQRAVLEAHLDLAAGRGLPVVIHQRAAEELLWEVLAAWRPRLAGVVLHCFTGDAAAVRRWRTLDVYFGLGGVLTFPRSGSLRAAVAEAMPPERIVLETDAPYLAPQPRRGRRNEPAYLSWVAEAVAACLGETPERVGRLTRANALRAFPRLAAAGEPGKECGI